MPSAREMRLRIRSVKNIGQITRALQAVSASKVRRAMAANAATQPYAKKAWQVLVHLAAQPGHASLHPLLNERGVVEKVLVVLITSDRGLAGASNINILRQALELSRSFDLPVSYVAIGRKGRDLLWRRRRNIIAEFSNLPSPPSFIDVSAIGRLIVDDYLLGGYDQVYLAYNEFHSMLLQKPIIRKLLPLDVEAMDDKNIQSYSSTTKKSTAVFDYEPNQEELLNEIVPSFIGIQVYQAILSAQASEHAARMVSMRNATDNASELVEGLQLEYNKVRQQGITNELLDIIGGAMAQSNQST